MQSPLVIKLSSAQIDSCCKCINSRLVRHKHFLSYALFTTFFQKPVLSYHPHIHKHYSGINVTIVNPEHRPQMATVREGVMKKEIVSPAYQGEVIRHDVKKYVADTDYVVKVIERHVEKAKNNLKGSPIIIAGGYGVGSKENFDLLFSLAKELHAEVGASRAAVDAGFAEHDRQIGQTGVTVRPKLYIACGISGQIQHIAGMQESGIIISINNDPDAPINTIADYVINGTIEEVVPKMIKYYKQNSK